MPVYTEVVPKLPSAAADRAVAEWDRLADGLVESEGLNRAEALAKALHARPDLVARIEADPQPRYPDVAPVAKATPLGPAGVELERLAEELRSRDRALSAPQSLAKAAHLNPGLAVEAMSEDVR